MPPAADIKISTSWPNGPVVRTIEQAKADKAKAAAFKLSLQLLYAQKQERR